jgi:threonine 3-dehydrogenase
VSPFNTPQNVPLNPTTVYGITKVYMENMGNYYNKKYGVDFRSLRYPGVISPTEYESHGTTDYASEIFFGAFKNKEYKICLAPERALPMVYLDDALDGTVYLFNS